MRGLRQSRLEVAVECAVAGCIGFTGGQHVGAAKLERIQAETARYRVHLRFRGEACLGSAKPSERAARNGVRPHSRSESRYRIPFVRTRDAVSGLDGGADAGVAIGAPIELDVGFPGNQPPLRRY